MRHGKLQRYLRQGAVGEHLAQLVHLSQIQMIGCALVGVLLPAAAPVVGAELRVPVELAGQDAHRQRAAHDHADVMLQAVGEDICFGRAVENAVIDLQRAAAAVRIELFRYSKSLVLTP
jgi:hypothetical protein